ncbi:unnamed protein product [Arctogadus glacialis]
MGREPGAEDTPDLLHASVNKGSRDGGAGRPHHSPSPSPERKQQDPGSAERHTGEGQHHIHHIDQDVPTPTSASRDSRYVSPVAGTFFSEEVEQACGGGRPGDPVGKVSPLHNSPIFENL